MPKKKEGGGPSPGAFERGTKGNSLRGGDSTPGEGEHANRLEGPLARIQRLEVHLHPSFQGEPVRASFEEVGADLLQEQRAMGGAGSPFTEGWYQEKEKKEATIGNTEESRV